MGIFSVKCKECKTKINVQLCPYCKKDICSNCLKRLVSRDKTPDWLIGKKLQNYDEYKNLYNEYCGLFRKKGTAIHCCNNYLENSWSAIINQVREMEKSTNVKAKSVILK